MDPLGMSTAYPRVHVVGSGAYYSYRPLTKNIEKVERNYYRENSSKPKDFGQYMAAMTTSRGDGYKKVPSLDHERDYGYRSLSLPPFDRSGRRLEREFDHEEADLRRYLQQKELLREKKEMMYYPEEDVLYRLRRKHPYRLLVEDEVVPPHESSIWPRNRKHFDLVSSYDTMIDYLGISDK